MKTTVSNYEVTRGLTRRAAAVLTLAVAVTGLTAAARAATDEQAPGTHRHPSKTSSPSLRPVSRPTGVPGLTINITDGRTAVRPGDRLTYTVRLKDAGATTAGHLVITLTFPAYLKLISASRPGRAAASHVTWHASLRPGQTEVFLMTARLAKTPPGLARVAAVACAIGGSRQTIICAAHLDKIPGHSAARQASGPRAITATGTRHLAGLAVAAGAGLLTALLAALTARRIRARRPRRLSHRHSR